jgi:ribosomal protein S18 acetylase RimI-like enzyme
LFRIRAGTDADRPALERFMAGLQAHERTLDADLLAEAARHEGIALIAEDAASGDPLGFAIAHAETDAGTFLAKNARRVGRLTDLFVSEDARGRGIARALIAACEDHFRALGLRHMQIGVLARNARAQRLYEAAGYRDWLHIMTREIG